MRFSLMVSLTMVVVADLLASQQNSTGAAPSFRTQVDLVQLDVRVTDARGAFVPDLTAADFEILEDGRPQAVAAVSVVDLPVPAPPLATATPPVDTDVATNAGGESRLYVIAMEDSVSSEYVLRAKTFLARFVSQHFAPNDIGAVVWVGRGVARDTQDFTSSRRLLLAAIDRFQGGLTADPGAPPVDTRVQQSFGIPNRSSLPILLPDPVPKSSADERVRMMSLRTLVEFMGGIPGRRKALLYVSTGPGFDAFDILDYRGGAMRRGLEEAHGVLTAATRGGVVIYAIDPRGLSDGGGLGERAEAPSLDERAAVRDSQRNLSILAESAGGFAFTNQTNIDAAFARIVRENSSYYLLGFSSTNSQRDGRFRRVQVRVRRPGLTVVSRAGYVAPSGRPPKPAAPPGSKSLLPAVATAVAAPLPTPGLPMRVVAIPYRGTGRMADVQLVVEVDAARLALVERDGKFTGSVDVAWTAVRADGRRIPGGHFRSNLALGRETFTRATRNGLRFVSRFPMAPGRYQLRVAAGSREGPAGSVILDLEVIDYGQSRLAMSGLTLTTTQAAEAPTQVVETGPQDALPTPPSSRREFSSAERVLVFHEVYPPSNVSPEAVSVSALVRDDAGRVIRRLDAERASFSRNNSGFVAELPLAGFSSGAYVLKVEARVSEGRPESREIPFRVSAGGG